MSERKPLIWIVDDSATEGAITRHSLGSSYDYEYFEDGSIVVEKLTTSRTQPDLLILDWVMPGMHGDDVCRFLRSHEPTKDLPIIITTASRVETEDIVTGLASGADDYVARPFATEELRARVNAALRSRELAEMSKRERRRLAAVNRLAQALLHATDVRGVLDALAFVLVGGLCDGCGILLLPGQAHEVSLARHRSGNASAVAAITNVTDPCVRSFDSNEDARAQLPTAYKPYVEQLGLSGLAVLTLPESSPLQGVITLTRDGTSAPFDFDDISTVETCIEYCSLAIQNALRVDADRVARAQLDATLQSLPVGILVTDARGRMTLVNAAAAALLPGIAQAKDVGEVFGLAGWYNLDGTPVPPRWEPGQPLTAQRRQLLLHVAGEPARTVTVSTVPLLDIREGAVTVIEDISAERAVAVERERVARFQEEMVAIVGHDLRAPLGAFIAGTDLLQSIASDYPPLSPVVERLRRSGHRMTKIVEQLLDVTHARLGKGIPLDVRKGSLRTVIESVIAESALTNPKTSFEIIASSDVVGFWDADRMAQVVANLANNAAHYGRSGGPVIVELTATAETATILVKNPVRDKPIPPEMLGVLFDPFQRGRQSGGNLGGLGLGLYIVREVVHAHGGTIEVTSDTETTFRVILPRERSQARPALIT